MRGVWHAHKFFISAADMIEQRHTAAWRAKLIEQANTHQHRAFNHRRKILRIKVIKGAEKLIPGETNMHAIIPPEYFKWKNLGCIRFRHLEIVMNIGI